MRKEKMKGILEKICEMSYRDTEEMSYLTEHDLLDIKDNVSIVSITQIDDISHYPFNKL